MTLGANAMETLEALDRTKALLGLFKEISDATGTDAREDLHEFGGRDAEEGHARLSRSKPFGKGHLGFGLGKTNIFGEGKTAFIGINAYVFLPSMNQIDEVSFS